MPIANLIRLGLAVLVSAFATSVICALAVVLLSSEVTVVGTLQYVLGNCLVISAIAALGVLLSRLPATERIIGSRTFRYAGLAACGVLLLVASFGLVWLGPVMALAMLMASAYVFISILGPIVAAACLAVIDIPIFTLCLRWFGRTSLTPSDWRLWLPVVIALLPLGIFVLPPSEYRTCLEELLARPHSKKTVYLDEDNAQWPLLQTTMKRFGSSRGMAYRGADVSGRENAVPMGTTICSVDSLAITANPLSLMSSSGWHVVFEIYVPEGSKNPETTINAFLSLLESEWPGRTRSEEKTK